MSNQRWSLEQYLTLKEVKSYQRQSLEKYLTLKEVLPAPEFGKVSILEGRPTRAESGTVSHL
jgi:hypothetical protein